jgi:hypothetical protein
MGPSGNFDEFLLKLIIGQYRNYLLALRDFGPDFLNKPPKEIKDKNLYRQWYIRRKLELGKSAHKFFFDGSVNNLFEKICLYFGINVNAARENIKSIRTEEGAKSKLRELHSVSCQYEKEKKEWEI